MLIFFSAEKIQLFFMLVKYETRLIVKSLSEAILYTDTSHKLHKIYEEEEKRQQWWKD